MAGVTFTVYQLGKEVNGTCEAIDLRQRAAWNAVPSGTAPADLDAVKTTGFCVVEETTSPATDASGNATVSGLPQGLYYVEETGAPDIVVSTTAPFYVTLPYRNDDNTWLYNVHVSPKNQTVSAPSKTVSNPSNNAIGSTLTWTITQTVPALNSGDTYSEASVWDELDNGLTYSGTTSVRLTQSYSDPTTLVENGDKPLHLPDRRRPGASHRRNCRR